MVVTLGESGPEVEAGSTPEPGASPPFSPKPLDRDFIVWAYKLLLDREPESEDVIAAMQTAWGTTRDLRRALMASPEFRGKNLASLAYTPESNVVIAQLPSSLRLFVDLSDVAIGLNIARGRYEASELAFVQRYVKRGQSVLDIGANIGLFSIVMGDLVGPEGRVHAFEPLQQNLTLLERSIRENRMEARITVRRALVGDAAGERQLVSLSLQEGAMNSGGAYLQTPGTPVPAGHTVESVPMVTLDTEDIRSPVSFIKIDVEGAEPFVFRGAKRLLAADRPVILCEINPRQLERVAGCTGSDFIAELAALGYQCFELESGSPAALIDRWGHQSVGSVVFLPRESPARARSVAELEAELSELRIRVDGGLTRERRLREATLHLQQAIESAASLERRLQSEIERYASYHRAVENSTGWRIVQFLRRLAGRRW
jgi:FkbM family methyltransferase